MLLHQGRGGDRCACNKDVWEAAGRSEDVDVATLSAGDDGRDAWADLALTVVRLELEGLRIC